MKGGFAKAWQVSSLNNRRHSKLSRRPWSSRPPPSLLHCLLPSWPSRRGLPPGWSPSALAPSSPALWPHPHPWGIPGELFLPWRCHSQPHLSHGRMWHFYRFEHGNLECTPLQAPTGSRPAWMPMGARSVWQAERAGSLARWLVLARPLQRLSRVPRASWPAPLPRSRSHWPVPAWEEQSMLECRKQGRLAQPLRTSRLGGPQAVCQVLLGALPPAKQPAEQPASQPAS